MIRAYYLHFNYFTFTAFCCSLTLAHATRMENGTRALTNLIIINTNNASERVVRRMHSCTHNVQLMWMKKKSNIFCWLPYPSLVPIDRVPKTNATWIPTFFFVCAVFGEIRHNHRVTSQCISGWWLLVICSFWPCIDAQMRENAFV